MADIDPNNLILFSAACCCFSALYTDVPACIGCSAKEECLCIEYESCLKVGATPYGPGCTTGNGYWCKLSLFCCQYAMKTPAVLCKGKGQCFCCVQQASLPPDNDVPCMCATLFIGCYPKFGIFKKVSEMKG
eukprot:gene14840-10613_t